MRSKTRLTGNLRWSKSPTTGHWSCTFSTPDGSERTVSTKQSDKREAVKMARDAKLQWLNGTRFKRKVYAALQGCKKITTAHAIAEWAASRRKYGALGDRSIESYCSILRDFARHHKLEAEQPVLITADNVYDFINHSGKMSTRRSRLCVLAEWFDWLIAERYAVSNFPRSIGKIDMTKLSHEQKERTRKIPFTLDEVDRLLRYIRETIADEEAELIAQSSNGYNPGYSIRKRIDKLRFWEAAVIISRFTGLRLGDVATIEKACFTQDHINVWTRKRDKRVSLPLNTALRAAYLRHANINEERLFPAQYALYLSTNGPSSLGNQFRKIVNGAGLEDRSFHCLRSTFLIDAVDRLVESGMTRDAAVKIAASLAGHTEIATTEDHYLSNGATASASRPSPAASSTAQSELKNAEAPQLPRHPQLS